MTVIPAAGTIPWRRRDDGTLEVHLVHRPRYDDWSWPKGKVDPGEDWPVAAARETFEEAGVTVRLGQPLPPSEYTVLDRSGEPASKLVHYWAAAVTGGDGTLVNEIDQTVWLDTVSAWDRLDYARDRDQLRAVVRAHQDGTLETWPLALVRHARSVPRDAFAGPDDQKRPLVDAGRARARDLVPLLTAYGVRRLVSSPSVRCADTLKPCAESLGRKVKLRQTLSEEGFAADPTALEGVITAELARARPLAVCTHGPVLPDLLGLLRDRVHPDAPEVRSLLKEATRERLVKGEALVCHVSGRGEDAQIVAAERHLP